MEWSLEFHSKEMDQGAWGSGSAMKERERLFILTTCKGLLSQLSTSSFLIVCLVPPGPQMN